MADVPDEITQEMKAQRKAQRSKDGFWYELFHWNDEPTSASAGWWFFLSFFFGFVSIFVFFVGCDLMAHHGRHHLLYANWPWGIAVILGSVFLIRAAILSYRRWEP